MRRRRIRRIIRWFRVSGIWVLRGQDMGCKRGYGRGVWESCGNSALYLEHGRGFLDFSRKSVNEEAEHSLHLECWMTRIWLHPNGHQGIRKAIFLKC